MSVGEEVKHRVGIRQIDCRRQIQKLTCVYSFSHYHLIRFDEELGVRLETSAFKPLYGGQFTLYKLS